MNPDCVPNRSPHPHMRPTGLIRSPRPRAGRPVGSQAPARRSGAATMMRWRRRAAVSLALALTAATLGASSSTAATGAFDDVTGGVHQPAIDALAAQGIFDDTHCGPDMFCPDEAILRSTMAVWVVRALDGENPEASDTSRFEDVDADEWWAPYVERLTELDVTSGCSSEPALFCPQDSVIRAQIAAFLVRAFELDAAQPAGFDDVDAESVHATSIDALYAAGITAGCSSEPALFCPQNSVTRAQKAAFLHRADNLPDTSTQPQTGGTQTGGSGGGSSSQGGGGGGGGGSQGSGGGGGSQGSGGGGGQPGPTQTQPDQTQTGQTPGTVDPVIPRHVEQARQEFGKVETVEQAEEHLARRARGHHAANDPGPDVPYEEFWSASITPKNFGTGDSPDLGYYLCDRTDSTREACDPDSRGTLQPVEFTHNDTDYTVKSLRFDYQPSGNVVLYLETGEPLPSSLFLVVGNTHYYFGDSSWSSRDRAHIWVDTTDPNAERNGRPNPNLVAGRQRGVSIQTHAIPPPYEPVWRAELTVGHDSQRGSNNEGSDTFGYTTDSFLGNLSDTTFTLGSTLYTINRITWTTFTDDVTIEIGLSIEPILPKEFTLRIGQSSAVKQKTRIAQSNDYSFSTATDTTDLGVMSLGWERALDPELTDGETIDVQLAHVSDFSGAGIGEVRALRARPDQAKGSAQIVAEWERPARAGGSSLPTPTSYRVELWEDFVELHHSVTVPHRRFIDSTHEARLDDPEAAGDEIYSVWVIPLYGSEDGEPRFTYAYVPG